MSVVSEIAALATRVGGEIKAVRSWVTTQLSGKVDTSRQVTAGTGLTGGGTLTADRSFAVSYGTAAGTAAQGNDTRLSDPRTPLAHTHGAADTTTGTFALARIPTGTTSSTVALGSHLHDDRYPLAVATQAITYASAVTPDASTGSSFAVTATAAMTLNSPNGGRNGQTLIVAVTASGANRAVTLAGIGLMPDTVSPFTVASAKTGYIGLLREAGGSWRCMWQRTTP